MALWVAGIGGARRRQEEHGERDVAGRQLAAPDQFLRLEAEKIELGAQGIAEVAHFARHHQPDRTGLDPVAFGEGRRLLFRAPLGRDETGAGNRPQQAVDLTLENGDFMRRDGVGDRRSEAGEGCVFQAFADAHEARQTHAVEVFGEAVDRDREFDEVLERPLVNVIFPAAAQDVEAIVDHGAEKGAGGKHRTV